jgi:hypothetical protein
VIKQEKDKAQLQQKRVLEVSKKSFMRGVVAIRMQYISE